MDKSKSYSNEERFVQRVVSVSAIITLIAAVLAALVWLNLDSFRSLSANFSARSGNYTRALEISDSIPDEELSKEVKYQIAGHMSDRQSYSEAAELYSSLSGYKNCDERFLECSYNYAEEMFQSGSYSDAMSIFASLGDYSDSESRYMQTIYAMAEQAEEQCNHSQAIKLYLSLGDYSDSYEKAYEIALSITNDRDSAKDVLSLGGLAPESISQALVISERRSVFPVTVVDAGAYHTVLLHSDGTVSACGDNSYGQCDVDGWKDIIQISAGAYHTVGLKKDGTVVAVGDNSYGQCDVSAFKDIIEIACADTDTYALSSDGRVSMCGYHKYDVITRSSGINSIFAGSYAVTVETGAGTYLSSHVTYQPEPQSQILSMGINTGYYISLSPDGTLTFSFDPEKSWNNIAFFDAGPNGIVAADTTGRIHSYFFRPSDQLSFSGVSDVYQCAAGTSHYVFLTEDGSVMAFGDDSYGQCRTDSLGNAF